MATRFYLPASGSSPSLIDSSGWGHNSSGAAARRTMDIVKSNTAMVTTAATFDGVDHLVNLDACVAQFCSPALAAQTINAVSITVQARWAEPDLNDNLFVSAKVYLLQSDGTT